MLPIGEQFELDRRLLGTLLRVTREEGFLTVRQVALASGLSFTHISKIELGQLDVSADKFVRLCYALGIPPGILLESCAFLSRMIYHVDWLNDEHLKAWAEERNLNRAEKQEGADFIAGTALLLSYLLKSSNPTFLLERIDFPVHEQKQRFDDFVQTLPLSEPPENRRALVFNLIADPFPTLRTLKLLEDSFLEKYLEQNNAKLPKDRKPWIPAPKQAYFHEFVGEADPSRRDINVAVLDHQRHERLRRSEKSKLTNINALVNIPGMQPKFPTLLARLKLATEERGNKTTLANYLEVPLVRVSQWLSGKREPGGEVTLQMLQWVEAEEAKQNKKPERVSPRPGQKTRSRKISYEKSKSNPQKR